MQEKKKIVSWGEAIERAYQRYLNYSSDPNWSNWKVYPALFYNQLVKDEVLNEDAYRSMMPHAKRLLIGEKQKERAVHEMRRPGEEQLHIVQSKISQIDADIQSLSSGERDKFIELTAKQLIIVSYFKECKSKKQPHIYVKEDGTPYD